VVSEAGGIVITAEAQMAARLADAAYHHRQHLSEMWPAPGICVGRCPGPWPCMPHRMATALAKTLAHHQPEQLHGLVEDYYGKVACPHGAEYDGDQHYEADDGWHCKALPTVIVCATCTDPEDDTLLSAWPCQTWAVIAGELGIEAPS
jgi:hypothetical protein